MNKYQHDEKLERNKVRELAKVQICTHCQDPLSRESKHAGVCLVCGEKIR